MFYDGSGRGKMFQSELSKSSHSSDWHIYINITSFSTTTPCFICQPTRIRYADNPIFYMIISFNKKPWSFLKICIAQLKWCAAQNWESESSHWITADPKSCSLLSLSFRNQSQSRPALSSSIGTPSCSDITLSRFSDDIWQKNDGWIVNQIWVYHSADAFKPDALAETWENCWFIMLLLFFFLKLQHQTMLLFLQQIYNK